MKNEKYLNIVKKFAQGEIYITDFECFCKNNPDFINYVKNFKFEENIFEKYDQMNWGNIFHQQKIHTMFCVLLSYLGIEYTPTKIYLEKCRDYYSVIPNWLNDSAVEWVNKHILSRVPEGLNKAQRKKWVKEQVERFFPCEKRKPVWAQGTEDWPQDEEGNFLTFVKQKENGDEVTYTFVDKKTNQEVEVREYY